MTQSDSIDCISNYFDESGASDVNTAIELSITDSCSLEGNLAFYPIGDEDSLTGSSTNRVVLTLENVFNPD